MPLEAAPATTERPATGVSGVYRGEQEAARRSDAFVSFGATGDLAFTQIFLPLLGLIRDEGFDPPTIGIPVP